MADYRKIRAAMAREYLDFLPEEIYDKSNTSHMVRLMDALCGDSGVMGERKRLSLKRIQTELYETRYSDLDAMYSDIFALPRLKSEIYTYDRNDLLTWEQREEMDVKDAAYRRRIWSYMLAWQYGATVTGVELVAEAACGHPCQIVDMTRYDSSWGIQQGSVEYESLWGAQRTADGSTFAIVVMKDGDLTTEETMSISNLVNRLSPQDASYVICTKNDVLNALHTDMTPNTSVEISNITSSSDYWSIVRNVTGRNDWDYEKYPQAWIEPNVTKEAPRQALVYSQEEQIDYLTMIESVSASSEHVGQYAVLHSRAFPSLKEITADQTVKAEWAISQATNKWYSSSYYNGAAMLDWSYPLDLIAEYAGTDESGRYQRFWSSSERDGDEWLEIDLRRAVPINRIALNICRKPIQVIPYVSSASGEAEWLRIMDETGRFISYTTRAWGGASIAGEMLNIQFAFPTVQADKIKLEFRRLDVPYYVDLGDGALEEVGFLWSVEVSNVQLGHAILKRDDFQNATYFDPFGNRVDTSIRVLSPNGINNGDYWLSQPNIGEDAVEYLVLDFGAPKKVGYIDIEAIYAGCQMNVYSSDDGVNWNPYSDVFTLMTARYELPERTARYIKLEFTSLNAIPYEVVSDGIMVHTRRFPYAIRDYVNKITEDSRVLSVAQMYLTTPFESRSEWDAYNVLPSVSEIYSDLNGGEISGGMSYRAFDSNIYTAYGSDMLMEIPVEDSTPNVRPVEVSRNRYKFVNVGEHNYDERDYERKISLAYVVGIKTIQVGVNNSLLALDGMGPIRVPLDNVTHVASNDGWVSTGERLVPSSGRGICSFETNDIQVAYAFRSFDFAVEQSPSIQRLQYPSRMSEEWHGVVFDAVSDEFGTNGTTLSVVPQAESGVVSGYGVESDTKLVHVHSMADFSVGMFAAEAGKWQLEVLDAFDKQILSMAYDVAARKWTTIGVTFTPQPAGGWWNDDYGFRCTIPLSGPVVNGQCIFLPNFNVNDMISAGLEAADTKLQNVNDIRIIYFNGIQNIELPYDCTGNMEMWFRAQQAIPSGYTADGALHRDINQFIGAYYVYFGNSNESEQPDRDYTKVFDPQVYSQMSPDVHPEDDPEQSIVSDFTPDGFEFDGKWLEIDDMYRISDGAGFMTVEINLLDALKNPTTIDGETFDQRYFVDYNDEDSDRQLQLYAYGTQLTFVIYEPANDGSKYENAWVGEYDSAKPQLTTSSTKLFIRWGEQGTENVYVNGTLAPNEKRRRKIEVYIGEAVQWPCIDNVYDEKRYNGGTY